MFKGRMVMHKYTQYLTIRSKNVYIVEGYLYYLEER